MVTKTTYEVMDGPSQQSIIKQILDILYTLTIGNLLRLCNTS